MHELVGRWNHLVMRRPPEAPASIVSFRAHTTHDRTPLIVTQMSFVRSGRPFVA